MASLSLVQLLVVALVITVSFLKIEEVNGNRVREAVLGRPREFDYFNLALQWPGTVCRRTRYCCPSNACCRGSNAPTQFTIHGLWPDYNDGTWPACCKRSNFDEKEISTLLAPLKKYWPPLSCGSSSTCYSGKGSFWAHEWEKHGTCSFPVIRDEHSYFLTTLNVYFKYNVTRVLNEAGFLPSNTERYPLGGIVTAIQNAFHMTPKLVCSKGAVEELHLCFYKDFKPRDCANKKDTCPKYVSLPAYASMRLHGEEATIPWRHENWVPIDPARVYVL